MYIHYNKHTIQNTMSIYSLRVNLGEDSYMLQYFFVHMNPDCICVKTPIRDSDHPFSKNGNGFLRYIENKNESTNTNLYFYLKRNGWTDKGIKNFKDNILFRQDGKHTDYLSINPKTGEIEKSY